LDEHGHRRVACGPEHSLALGADDSVWSWGSGTFGKLGHGAELDVLTPARIQLLDGLGVDQIVCGVYNSGCVTKGTTL